MAESAGIKRMSHRHEAIMDYMIAHPTLPLSAVAAEFNVTQPWLSCIIHSHAFQDQLARRHDELFDSAIAQPLGARLEAAATLTLDAYMDKIPGLAPSELADASNKLLGRLGFGTQKSAGVQIGDGAQVFINNGHVSSEVLKEARNRIGTHKVGTTDSQAALPDRSSDRGVEIEGVPLRNGGTYVAREEVRSDPTERNALHSEPVVQVQRHG